MYYYIISSQHYLQKCKFIPANNLFRGDAAITEHYFPQSNTYYVLSDIDIWDLLRYYIQTCCQVHEIQTRLVSFYQFDVYDTTPTGSYIINSDEIKYVRYRPPANFTYYSFKVNRQIGL